MQIPNYYFKMSARMKTLSSVHIWNLFSKTQLDIERRTLVGVIVYFSYEILMTFGYLWDF